MRHLLLAATALSLMTASASATQIISFGQTSGSNTITATDDGTVTNINTNGTGAAILIDQLFGVVTPPAIAAFMTLNATSIDAATLVGGLAVLQHYSGSFCISTGAGCTGTNELSGTFSDAAFGLNGGTQLSVNVANPPDTLVLSSSVIPAADLVAPSSFTLSMSNLPALSIDGNTIAAFTSSFSGVANATTVSEPGSLALMGIGLLGMGMISYRKKNG